MHIIRSFLVISASLTLFPLAAFADTGGWYVAADVGQSHFDGVSAQAGQIVTRILQNTVQGIPPTTTTDNDTSYRLTVGYRFNSYWGLEASYIDFGRARVDENNAILANPFDLQLLGGSVHATIKAHAWAFTGTGTYPFNEQWSAFVHLGVTGGYVNLSVNGYPAFAANPPSVSQSSSGRLHTTYGVGVNWSFTNHWSVRLGWDQYPNLGNSNTTGEYSISLVSVGVMYRF